MHSLARGNQPVMDPQIQAYVQAQIAALQAQKLQVQAPGPFALFPVQAQQNIVDLSTASGIKLHKQIVAPLFTPYNGAPEKLPIFLAAISDRAASSNWGALLTISDQVVGNPQDHNLITQHRMLSLTNVHAHAGTYVGQQNCRAQDSAWMYKFLRDSLTKDARICILLLHNQYTIQGQLDGPSYFKVLLMTFFVETNATNFLLRETLHNLPQKMVRLKSNVTKLNTHVRTTVTNLASGGGVSDDLLVYLFNSYKVVDDHIFKRWIAHKKEDYDDGKEVPTVEELMTAAQTKYNQLTLGGQWKEKSPKEKDIIALRAELQMTKAKLADLTSKKPAPSAKKKPDKYEDPKTKETTKTTTGKCSYPAWCKECKGKQKELKRDGKQYYWCDTLRMWATHKPTDCKAAKTKAKTDSKDKDKGSQPDALALARALISVTSGNNADDNNPDDI